MKLLAFSVLVAFMAPVSAWADDDVRRIQEALRKRHLYFGELDGRNSNETIGAIRRFQQRQGLPPTGEATPPTLTSLGIAKPARGGIDWPDGPILKGDAAIAATTTPQAGLTERLEQSPSPVVETRTKKEHEAPVHLVAADKEELTTFVRKYLAACAANRLSEEMVF
jgi:peptidoglycan hydrolase-like protein with peptidoglycan-binding domain